MGYAIEVVKDKEFLLDKLIHFSRSLNHNMDSFFMSTPWFTKEASYEDMKKEILDENTIIFVVMHNYIPVGYAHVINHCEYYSINALWIEKEHRNKGLAKDMLHTIEQEASKSEKAEYITLCCCVENTVAYDMYIKDKFKPISTSMVKQLIAQNVK